ncbi:peptidase domain-containing ABC transporter [Piscinibacter terrae]|uniref:Cyclolysin secretion/processing ATP-binding protein CyaB n=1 Tax=Piscinibacter terrae TaxID=2496871 RepID=A0A3N7HPZ0_9BURK|nr:peptidase domain-containing ABC transporter [Albitalea terrae]RQP24288.1 peptidase domain-containing ABC transporter [Albitalea terrae]
MSGFFSSLKLGFGKHSVPMLLQTEAAECGLASLAMVAAYHGLHTDMPTLRQRFSLSLKGVTMVDLTRIAGQMKLNPRALRAELEHLPQLQMPCVLHWDLNHFVVLADIRHGKAVIHDPARGIRHLSMDEVSKHFTGVVLELTPAAEFERKVERQSVTLKQLLGRVSGLKRSLLQVFALALALEVFMLLSPFFMQWTVDSVLVAADRDLLVTLGLGFGLLVFIQVATGAIRSWSVLYLSATLNLQWLSNVFAHLMRLPVSWFEKRHTGDVMSRFGAIQQIQQTLTTSFIEVVLDGLLVVMTLVMMSIYSGTLTLIALGCVAAYAGLRWAFFKPLRTATEEAIIHDAKKASHFLESLRGVQSIKLFNRQEDRQGRFMNLVVDAMNANIATRKLDLMFGVLHKLVFGLERVAVIWVGSLLVLDRSFSVGMLFAFIAYKEQFALRVSGLIDKAVELKMLKLQGERLADIVLTPPETEVLVPPRADLSAHLELRGVGFRYSDAEPVVLKNVNFAIEPGESVAIVGPSGCGKTTLLKLILGIHEPQVGEVRVGGVPLAHLGLRTWRDMIGTVMQDDQLFAGSIIDNISFFDATPDLAWVEECARLASVHDEVAAMPMGFHTLIGDMGTSISGGQKQRLLLARALYKRPKILLLDEATSALDVDRERLVNQSVKQLELTRVIVAHRPETIASASRVIVLKDGRVAQDLRSVDSATLAK